MQINLRSFRIVSLVLSAGLVAASCTASKPTNPSTSGTAPRALQPAPNAAVKFGDQPLVLTVENAVITGSGTTTYTFDVATDTGFQSIVQTKDVTEGPNGQTSVVLDSLTGPKDYYWRVRAKKGSA